MPLKPAPVSVIIPCYKCADTIERALMSIIKQTRPVSEIILVDDFSGDNTLDKLFELNVRYADWPIRVIAQSANQGPGPTRNAGWKIASQPWIAFLDADDIWHSRKIDLQFSITESNEKIDLCAHETAEWSGEELAQSPLNSFEIRKISPIGLLFKNSIPTRSVLMKRDLPFVFEGKSFTEDYLLWLSLALSGYGCYKYPAKLAYSFKAEYSKGGYSGNLWQHEKKELRCLKSIFAGKLIGLNLFLFASFFSLLKYFRRVLISSIRS